MLISFCTQAEAKSAKDSANRTQAALDKLLKGIRDGKFEGSEGGRKVF